MRELGQLGLGHPKAFGDDAFGIGPMRGTAARAGERAAEENFNLVKARSRVVESVDETRGADVDLKTCFLVDFAGEVLRKALPCLDPATGGAEKRTSAVWPGIHKEKLVLIKDERADGNARRFGAHGVDLLLSRSLESEF